MRSCIAFFIICALFMIHIENLKAANEINSGVFRLNLQLCGSDSGNGSLGFVQTGFRAEWRGQQGIITALHGVAWCDQYIATQGFERNAIDLTDLKLSAVDVDRDIAFLSSNQLKNVPGGPLGKTSYQNYLNDSLKVVGYPDGALSQISHFLRYHENPLRPLGSWHQKIKNMCQQRNSPNCRTKVLLVAGEPLIAGHSGSPIFNQTGLVVGIAGGGLKGGVSLMNWIIPFMDVELRPVSEFTSRLDSLRKKDINHLFASVSTVDESRYPSGFGTKIKGKILYGGYRGPTIGAVTNYSQADAVIGLYDHQSRKHVPVSFTYNKHTSEYTINNVPVGNFGFTVRLSGYPQGPTSGGDFISYLSGLNDYLTVAPGDKNITRNLKVVHSIHLKQPVNNQIERTFTYDEPEIINRDQNLFTWDHVPGVSYYEIYLYLKNKKTKETHRLINPYKTSSNIYRARLKITAPDSHYIFRVSAYHSNGSLLGHFSNYYKNGFGGWFKFRVR